jgi:hypothetical protein
MIGAFSREAKKVKDNESEVNEHHAKIGKIVVKNYYFVINSGTLYRSYGKTRNFS